MASATPDQPSSDDAAHIVGVQLETDLVEAGLQRPAAKAVQHALELIVLRLLLVLATKQDLRDLGDEIRREFSTRFSQHERAADARFDQQERAADARFDQQERAADARFDQHERAVDARFEQQERAFDARFDQQERAADARFEQQERAFNARFDQQEHAADARFNQHDRAIDDLRRDLRWGFGLIITIGVAILIAVLTTMISVLSNGS